jgi:hypothetical protein
MGVENSLIFLGASQLFICKLPLPLPTDGGLAKIPMEPLFDTDFPNVTIPIIFIDITSSTVCVALGREIWMLQDHTPNTNFSEFQFAWRKMSISSEVCSLACHSSMVAVGEQSGNIHLFFDVFDSLGVDESPQETIISWHQSPVSSLEFSGNGSLLLLLYSNA